MSSRRHQHHRARQRRARLRRDLAAGRPIPRKLQPGFSAAILAYIEHRRAVAPVA